MTTRNTIIAGVLARRRALQAAPDAPAPRQRRTRPVQAEPEPTPPAEGIVVDIPGQDTIITDIIKKSRVEMRPARDKDYLHVSDLLHRCMRKMAIEERFELPIPPQQLSFMDSTTFAQGDAIADVVMRRLGNASREHLWGKWKCKCGHLRIDDPCVLAEVDTDDACERCGTACDTYVEVSQFNDEYKIVGNPDALLYYKQLDAFHIAELKSIAHAQFLELARAKPEHVIQALFYWWIMRNNGINVGRCVSIFYTTKGYVFPGKGDPYKEFSIDAMDSVHRLDDYLADAMSIKTFRAGSSLPPRIKCASALSPDAKKCSACHLCFSEGIDAS